MHPLASSLPGWALFRARALGLAPSAAALARALAVDLPRAELAVAPEATLWAALPAAVARFRALVAADAGRSAALATSERTAAPGDDAASLLDLAAALARRLLAPCRLCHLRCPVDRTAGPAGRCGLGPGLRVYRDYVHLGEEQELVPTHAVFLAGCNWRCAYCSDWAHVARPEEDPETTTAALARSIDARRAEGARSLTFVGGLPDVNLPGVLDALAAARASVPVVWNSNLSATPEAHDLLEVAVDAWVADLKYGGEACSRAGSAAPDALARVHENLLRVAGQAPTPGYLVVRHLVLPGHTDCCARPALDWVAAHLPGARVNLMGQFEPIPEVRGTAWDRRPAREEVARAREHARALGLDLDLDGPGPLDPPGSSRPGPWAAVPGAAPGAPAAAPAFESAIRIDADGRVVLEDLPPDLADLAHALGALAEADRDPADEGAAPGDLARRRAAAAPWLAPDPPGPGGCFDPAAGDQ